MKIHYLPKFIRVLVFDIDLTLYDSHEYYDSQKYLFMHRLAQHLGISYQETSNKVAAIREEYRRSNEKRSLTLGQTVFELGISLEENISWRNELFQPEDFLTLDLKLAKTLEILQKTYQMAAVTNNTSTIGLRTLKVLGVNDYFPIVIGIDISKESKPTMKPFNMLAEKLNIPINQMLSIGDRFAVDLELPLENGMGGILIEQVSEVYELPSILKNI